MNFHDRSGGPHNKTAFRASSGIYIDRDLENRLITFSLGCGAISAQIDRSHSPPVLVTIAQNGLETRISLTGTAAGWHGALNAIADIDDEDASAGLFRILRTRSPNSESHTQAKETEADNNCFGKLTRTAA